MARTQTVTRARRRSAAPPQTEETREQKFRRLGEARVTRAINSVRLVGNLASPNYAYSEEDAQRVIAVLEGALQSVRDKFSRKKGKHTLAFSWDGETAH